MTDTTSRPVASTKGGIAGAGATSMNDLANRLLLLQPLAVELVDTIIDGVRQQSEATVCQVIEVGQNGAYVDHGEHPVFWSYVRTQLKEQTSPELPWLCGTVERGQRAFRVVPPTPAQLDQADRALSSWKLATEQADEAGKEAMAD